MKTKKIPICRRKSTACLQGKVNCIPRIADAAKITVEITGDADGLRSLAKMLAGLADNPEEIVDTPPGLTCHLHFYPERDLGWHSCELVLSRADDLVTGALPDYMS